MKEVKSLNEVREFVKFYERCVVVYSSLRCPPCRRLHAAYKDSSEIAGVPAICLTIEYLKPEELHSLAEDPDLVLRAVPTTAIYVKGKIVHRVVGFRDKKSFESEVRAALRFAPQEG